MSAPANIHLIVGEDDYLAEATARKIVEAAVPVDLRGSAVETVSGDAQNEEAQLASLAACRASVQTPPFLDPVKLTWWRGVTFLPGGGRNGKTTEAVGNALRKFAEELASHPLPGNQFLVITATKLLKTSIFAKTFKGFAQVVEFGGGGKSRDRQESALARLPDLAAEERLSFAPGADAAFIAKVGTDTRVVVSELAKMRTYLGAERDVVTKEDVAAVASVGGEEPELWEITDALAQRNPAKLVATLANFEGKSGFGMLLATVAEKFFRELIVYRDALDNGWLTPYGTWARDLPPQAAEDLNAAGVGPAAGKTPWLVKRGAANARQFTLRELRLARYRMLQVRERLVSSSSDDSIVASELLRIIVRPPARPTRK
ncbi:MAG: hypothetical protein IJI36_08760 [Kiritimatiellae bacterium]|nr:hypothetical protein [Kiritimatiellia bacterium]